MATQIESNETKFKLTTVNLPTRKRTAIYAASESLTMHGSSYLYHNSIPFHNCFLK